MTRIAFAARRRPALALLAAAILLSGCISEEEKAELNQSVEVDAITDSNLSDVMLTLADTQASVEYFRRAVGRDPSNVELRRGLALSLARDGQNAEANRVFEALTADGHATPADLTAHAGVLGQLDRWDEAEAAMARQPEGYVTARQQQMLGMIADHKGDWPAADVHYDTARRLAVQPAPIWNNIGVSMLARRDYKAAEDAFREALKHDPTLFAAKNNLGLAFALQKRYALPVVAMSEEERAILMHNMALQALRNGDRKTAINLLERSVETHPRRWAPASDKLAALRAGAKG